MSIRRWHQQHGQALVLMVAGLGVLITMVAASITVGTVYLAKSRLQNAVDAAALAGAQVAGSPGQTAFATAEARLISQEMPGATGKLSIESEQRVVSAQGSVTVPGTFATLIGIKHFTARSRAVASYGPGPAFNYAIFQGDPHASDPSLTINGNDAVIGSVHSNNNLNLIGNLNISGSCGGNPTVTSTGNGACGRGFIQNAPEVPMPQWTPQEATPANATTYGSPSNPTGLTLTAQNDTSGNAVVYGNLSVTGGATISGNYLVYGNVTLNGHGGVSGAGGSITAFNGSITLNGDVRSSTNTPGQGMALAALSSSGGFHSAVDSIIVNGNGRVTGTLYAPNGTITINGNVKVKGQVIGYQDVITGSCAVNYSNATITHIPVHQPTLIQ